MIGECALAIEMGADAVDIGKTIHPHPTLGESIGMAAEVAHGSCTDLPPDGQVSPAGGSDPDGTRHVARELVKLGGTPKLREGMVTDNGNLILDVHGLSITDPVGLEADQPDCRRRHQRPVCGARRRCAAAGDRRRRGDLHPLKQIRHTQPL
jgi:hypothetical protein